jgi:hypothetical protein
VASSPEISSLPGPAELESRSLARAPSTFAFFGILRISTISPQPDVVKLSFRLTWCHIQTYVLVFAWGSAVAVLDALQIFGLILLFFVCGSGIAAPLKNQIAFPAAASIFAGVLALPSAALTIHVVTSIKFWWAIWIAAAALTGLSVVTFDAGDVRKRVSGRGLITVAMVTVLVAASCFVYLGLESRISSPALVFFAGSDQFGYAHLADWLNGNPGNVGFDASPENPWESWVQYMVTSDPRFGSISLAAIVSALTGRSGMFSYNLSCAMVMVTASVGLAGMFSQTVTGFVIVAVGVFLSSWLTVSMAGFFGKMLGYPTSLFSVGMFFALARSSDDRGIRLPQMVAVLAVVIGACISFSALGTTVILLSIGAVFLLMSWLSGVHQPRKLAELFVALLTLAAVGILSGGTIARPMYAENIALDTGWTDLWLRAAQVIGPDANLSFVPLQYQLGLAVLVAASTVGLFLIAVRSRNDEAVAMILGVAILAAMLAITGKRWEFQQSLTIYVPAILCAVGALLVHSRTFWYKTVAALSTIIIAAGVGRFAATLHYTVGAGTNPRFLVEQSETDTILTAAGSNGGAYIDTPDVYSTYPLVLEMHRAGIDYQLSPQAWKSFLGYRPWNSPKYSKRKEISVTLRDASSACPAETVLCSDHYILAKTAQ